MTVGLAAYDKNGIYLAIESMGTERPKGPSHFTLSGKILQIQQQPNISLMMAGGMEHWLRFIENYHSKSTLNDAANHIKDFFDSFLISGQQIYGYLFSYENSEARYVYIERAPNGTETIIDFGKKWSSQTILNIGYQQSADEAKKRAELSICKGDKVIDALKNAIESIIDDKYENVQPPVITRTILSKLL